MSIRRAIFIGLILALAGQFAFAQNDDGVGADELKERVCVNVRTIRTFDALTDQYVYVRQGSNKHFLFTMRNRCPNLRDAQSIAIKDTTSRVCSDGFGEIVYRDRFGGRGLESCRIGKIEVVESKDDAIALVEALKKAKDAEKDGG
ncbi:MAG: DUF6491 family protein [Gammaproteobacteria bacterium]|nr:DUF6491 family protein [Gammaproteobacteria bacterium]